MWCGLFVDNVVELCVLMLCISNYCFALVLYCVYAGYIRFSLCACDDVSNLNFRSAFALLVDDHMHLSLIRLNHE